MQPDTCVAELIEQRTGRWKGPFIDATFTTEEAEVIKNIPLNPLKPKDRLILRGTPNGVFTVWSANHMRWRDSHSLEGIVQIQAQRRKHGRCDEIKYSQCRQNVPMEDVS